MLTLPQTAEYALRAVCCIAEREAGGPVPVSAIAERLGAPQNYLSKTLHQLGSRGVLQSVRGAHGGYRLGIPAEDLRLAAIIEPFLPPVEHKCIMGRTQCGDDTACGAHWRWKAVKETTRAFFEDVTVADLLASPGLPLGPRLVEPRAAAAGGR